MQRQEIVISKGKYCLKRHGCIAWIVTHVGHQPDFFACQSLLSFCFSAFSVDLDCAS